MVPHRLLNALSSARITSLAWGASLAWGKRARLTGGLALLLGAGTWASPALGQDSEAAFREVVLAGAEVPRLLGAAPDRVAAFAYAGGAWTPIPVQVDERERLDLAVAFDGRASARCAQPGVGFCFDEDGTGVETLEYTSMPGDTETFVGADSDPTFDRDDEVVFMQRFAGPAAPADAAPAGADPATRTAVRLGGDALARYVYLFVVPTGAVPRAPERLVRLDFALAEGAYPRDYDAGGVPTNDDAETGPALGANPEATTVETAHYRLGFSDRWIHDELRLKRGGRLGPDLLDRQKVLLELGSCTRTEWTASSGRGTIVTLRDGPVRAIRVVRGFNSGPLTTAAYFFYEQHSVMVTDLRVHPIPGVVDFYDYSPEALGMRYTDALTVADAAAGPFVLDGESDGAALAPLERDAPFWSLVSGEPGALVHAYRIETDWSGAPLARYWDEGRATRQCTGDERAIGASGVAINGRIPPTDPRRDDEWVPLQTTRVVYYSAAPLDAAEAVAIAAVSFPALAHEVEEGAVDPEGAQQGAAIEALRPSVVTSGRTEAEIALYEAGAYDVAVYDLLGRRVFSERVAAGAPRRFTLPVALPDLPAGAYWLRVASLASGAGTAARLTVLR